MTDRRVRIVSYNVHACIGRDRRFAPERIAGLLQELEADFVALQEVEDRPWGDGTVSDYLAECLDMHPHRGATLYRGDARYGNLLLAREPAVAHRLHDLSVGPREPRGAIEADFLVAGRKLRLFVTHLGLRGGERKRQSGGPAPPAIVSCPPCWIRHRCRAPSRRVRPCSHWTGSMSRPVTWLRNCRW
jgi:endonuclease/exonuclease/phosphatase family metal-dependent hydrolase